MQRLPTAVNVRGRLEFDNYTIALILGSATFLYVNLFAFLATPFLLSGDQVYFWMNSERLLAGERIYQDFFQFTPPGTDLVYLSLFKLFGPRLWTTNAVVLALGVLLTWVCFKIAKLVMEKQYALLAACLFLCLIYGKALNGTHHWFSVLAVMSAVAILLNGRSPQRIIFAGMLLGAASFFTQTRGVFAAFGIAAFLFAESVCEKETWPSLLKRQIQLFVPLIAIWTLLSGYFIATGGFRQLWYFQATYVREFMVNGWTTASLGLPETLAWRNLLKLSPYLFIYILLPVVYLAGLWRSWRERRDPSRAAIRRIALVSFTGVAMLIEVALSVNWLRLYCVAMPGIILFVWLFEKAKLPRYATSLLWVAVLGMALVQTWVRHHQASITAELPAGRTATTPHTYEKAAWLAQHTKPGQKFFQAAWPGLYLPLGLRNPVYLDVLETGDQTRPQYVELSIRQLEAQQVKYILWSPRLDSRDSRQPAETYHLNEFRRFLRSQYQRVCVFSDQDEVWQRNDSGILEQ
ncbi:MAG TPA: hypothetical protein VK525_02590 [Candidatus Saccharimonadales bacterium]|nr:hypothetical protein [Candidatus Saccharimonadales bacterium]